MMLLKQLTDAEWAALSAIGAIASAVISLIGLWFVVLQLRASTKVADIDHLQSFLATTTQLERAFMQASDQSDKEAAFFELLNYLEFLAAGIQKGNFRSLSREFIRDKLVDALALIEIYPEWQHKLEGAKSTPTSLTYLTRFRRKNRCRVERAKTGFTASNKIRQDPIPLA